MRRTKQRAMVADILDDDERFRGAQQIYDELRAAGKNIGLTTVYRTLQSLAQSGDLDSVLTDDGLTLYRRCRGDAHHHHLVCRSCGKTIELPADEVEAWVAKVAKRHSFADLTHTVEMFGRCATCRTR